MNRRHIVALLLATGIGVGQGRAQGQREPLRLLTYNVENLFDTCHDAGFDDYEFLPPHPVGGPVSAIGANWAAWCACWPPPAATIPWTSWH